MKIKSTVATFITVVICSATLMTLNGCGIKGPLYMPHEANASQQEDQEKSTTNMQQDSELNSDLTPTKSKATEQN